MSEDLEPETVRPAFGHVEPRPGQLPTSDATAEVNQQAEEAAKVILAAAEIDRIHLACTLGSGWGEAAGQLGTLVTELDAEDVPGFETSGVPGHSGTLQVVRTDPSVGAEPKHILVIGARTHFYEGRGVGAVAHGVRSAAAAGAEIMVLTNGCGSLRPEWAPGTPVMLADHINLTAASPLQGAHFVDLTDLYSPRIRRIAAFIEPHLAEGVYAQLPGPHYETPAEIRYLRTIGADLVGMSTALEAIAARAAGMEVFGISLVTNLAAGTTHEPLSHQEVLEAGREAAPRISELLSAVITRTLDG
ncbi:purine-nucleoside phosphorylase [Nesterenkonia alba]|uniref:purine-nucleoside phosphorylase n=1 Tax=Nesterenkonia alba TaxID=515814 RepID=UPI0003B58A13|nr:purine-nucleoside phosphorylase [Nesterenkonia alba]